MAAERLKVKDCRRNSTSVCSHHVIPVGWNSNLPSPTNKKKHTEDRKPWRWSNNTAEKYNRYLKFKNHSFEYISSTCGISWHHQPHKPDKRNRSTRSSDLPKHKAVCSTHQSVLRSVQPLTGQWDTKVADQDLIDLSARRMNGLLSDEFQMVSGSTQQNWILCKSSKGGNSVNWFSTSRGSQNLVDNWVQEWLDFMMTSKRCDHEGKPTRNSPFYALQPPVSAPEHNEKPWLFLPGAWPTGPQPHLSEGPCAAEELHSTAQYNSAQLLSRAAFSAAQLNHMLQK